MSVDVKDPRLIKLRDNIQTFIGLNGYAPSVRDMQGWFKSSNGTPLSTSMIHTLLADAHDCGLVRLPPPGIARGVVPLHPDTAPSLTEISNAMEQGFFKWDDEDNNKSKFPSVLGGFHG